MVSGKKLVKLLNQLGYITIRQHKSHITLRKVISAGEHNITIPNHNEIAKGTLNDILKKVSIWNNISKDELIIMLKI